MSNSVHILKTATGTVLGHMTPKSEYYKEDPKKYSDEERMELFTLEGREATGLLWGAAHHVAHDEAAATLLHGLRDELIDDIEVNGEKSWAENNKSLFLYRRNNDPVYQAWLAEKEGR
jgi:hypothetical protein